MHEQRDERREPGGAGRPAVANGLEGVIAAATRLSDVDGERGRLVIAGEDVEALAGEAGFEDACARLWGLAGMSPEGAMQRGASEPGTEDPRTVEDARGGRDT